jgi:hypothetical protein
VVGASAPSSPERQSEVKYEYFEGVVMKRAIVGVLIPAMLVVVSSAYLTWHLRADNRAWRPVFYEEVITNIVPEDKKSTDFPAYMLEDHRKHAVKGDGSQVDVRTRRAPDGKWFEQRKILDVAARQEIVLDATTSSKTTYPIATSVLNRMVLPPQRCSSATNSPHRRIMGYDTEFETHGDATDARVEEWRAPALNCIALVTRVSRTNEGQEVVLQNRTVTSVTEEAPPDSWFNVPSDYIERSPGEVAAEYYMRYPSAAPAREASKDSVKAADEAYRKRRERK